jgi:hypothetical protein
MAGLMMCFESDSDLNLITLHIAFFFIQTLLSVTNNFILSREIL